MAAIANTFKTADATLNRESLHDIVSIITPEDTPIYSDIPKGKITSTHPEWGIDELEAPADNAIPEGDQYVFESTEAPDRVGNHSQIFRKTGIISKSQEATKEAGSVNKIKRTKYKRGIVLRKDVEFSILSANASVSGDTRRSGSLSTWIETNANRGAGGVNGGFNQSTKLTVAPTNGTQRAFSKSILDDVMQQGYEAGANFKYLYVSPYVKSVFVTFMSDTNVAAYRYAAKNGKNNSIVANADIYEGPFGMIMVKPNRVMSQGANPADRSRNAFLVDPQMLSWDWLRKIQEDKEARKTKTADADHFVIIGEGCLCVKNEAGVGVAADLFGLTASS